MSTTKTANQPHFIFFCGDLDKSTFSVINFSGKDAISSPYEFSIKLKSTNPDIKADQCVNKQATLFMYREGEYYLYSGIIFTFQYLESNVDYSAYHVVMVPKLRLLECTFQTRIFQKMTIPDIIEQVLHEAHLSDYYTLELEGTYEERENVIQYQESDLNFISRLMEEQGIWYFFKELPLLTEELGDISKEKLIISDKPASFLNIEGEKEILYRTGRGMFDSEGNKLKESVTQLSSGLCITPQSVLVKNYNYRTPEVDLIAPKSIKDGLVGKVYTFGNEIKNPDSAEKIAEQCAQRIISSQTNISGKSNCRGFRAGMRFNLSEHIREECNDTYLLVSVYHYGIHRNMTDTDSSKTYTNKFAALPSSFIPTYKPQLTTQVPKINGIITASIETGGSEYAGLDEMGRYKVRMPFDLSDSANYEASKYIRLAQPYSGPNYGLHFPSHEGTEMVLACIDGNPDRLVGIGTIPNANTISPVVSNNKTQNIIRTAGGNEIILEDLKDRQKVTMQSNGKNSMVLDDENKKITINTTGTNEGNNSIILNDKDQFLSLGGLKHLIRMSYGEKEKDITIQTENEHCIKIDDKNKIITINTSNGHIVQLDDSEKTITIADGDGKNTITLDGKKNGLSLDSEGEISIRAKGDLTIEAANITMKANQSIEASANMDLTLKSQNIESKADMNMSIEGGLKTDISGLRLNAEGKLSANFKGGSKTTITGGVVMIN